MDELNIVDLIENNPITKLTGNNYQSKMISKIKKEFNNYFSSSLSESFTESFTFIFCIFLFLIVP